MRRRKETNLQVYLTGSAVELGVWEVLLDLRQEVLTSQECSK